MFVVLLGRGGGGGGGVSVPIHVFFVYKVEHEGSQNKLWLRGASH
jgi:hypothetical protein